MTKEIETSKGNFLVVEAIENANVHTGLKLSEITEEELFEFSDLTYSILHFKNIKITPNTYIFKT